MQKRIFYRMLCSVIAVCYMYAVHDASHMPCIASHGIMLFDITPTLSMYTPDNVIELQHIMKTARMHGKKVAIVGAGKSQGGQTVSSEKNSIRISLHKLNKLIYLDVPRKQVTVEAGMTWRQLQEYIAPHGLAIKAMQSYNDFSIGGSIAVNVHGQDLSTGQIISTIIAMNVLLPNGDIVLVSRTEHYDLFKAIVGGYGIIGVVLSATLQLTDDILLERHLTVISTDSFERYFNDHIRNNPAIEFYSARFSMGVEDFMENALVITYTRAFNAAAQVYPLLPVEQNPLLRRGMQATGCIPYFKSCRFYFEKLFLNRYHTISRNNFLNYSILGLPQDTSSTEYILQEYFIPYDHVGAFIKKMRRLIEEYGINILNVTARHVLKDTESLLSFSPQKDMCALVLYIKLLRTEDDREQCVAWTRSMIDQAIDHEGTYYLPYHLLATQAQFETVYPQWLQLMLIKWSYDPELLLSNQLFEYYGRCMQRVGLS